MTTGGRSRPLFSLQWTGGRNVWQPTPEERKAICAKGQATRKANREKREAEKQATLLRRDLLRREVAALEAKLFALRDIERMSVAGAALTGKTLLMHHEIAAAALPWKHATGIYFLLDGDDVVYVGQSRNVYSRISSHPAKNFNRYAFVPCAVEALDKLESLYIHLLRPKLNGRKPDGSPFAPLALDSLI
ncbi:GIY-YIG nuclease family protein [Morganella morganii]|uniref:GIY-YIG nuclease family protein n=1 Tax=Morganella morganii TaxID=582 RepID=UPI0031381555|nr:GIY-YIG nuclease family protein [Pseudomonas aeruginosa]